MKGQCSQNQNARQKILTMMIWEREGGYRADTEQLRWSENLMDQVPEEAGEEDKSRMMLPWIFPCRAGQNVCGSTWEWMHIPAHTFSAPAERHWPHATWTTRGSQLSILWSSLVQPLISVKRPWRNRKIRFGEKCHIHSFHLDVRRIAELMKQVNFKERRCGMFSNNYWINWIWFIRLQKYCGKPNHNS